MKTDGRDPRQAEVERWFRMACQKGRVSNDDFHAFCKWAKGKQQNEVFLAIQGKRPMKMPR